jgi:uncharacterized protein
MDDGRLIAIIRSRYAGNWDGIHGMPHWLRVRENGLRLAGETGAHRRVVEVFALLHDSQRVNDGRDPEHGPRAAAFAESLGGDGLGLDSAALVLLAEACRGHSYGLMTGDITVLTCWDADRLDLGRVGIRPAAHRLCTDAARDPAMIEWAYRRSTA